ncbi:MAG: hypothetical protein GY913_31850 [Proteobacteria bacterium]|nr:hypothetical protein [Pseudomonadota bacterium]MCP4921514.1 hypothetical protein [Pseudomonadota bacterium]
MPVCTESEDQVDASRPGTSCDAGAVEMDRTPSTSEWPTSKEKSSDDDSKKDDR